jgi:CelD/BcsL family acetyltransferase involved in cellulose biosynthesis
MRFHDDSSTAALDRPPIAAHTGPFPRRAFLEVWGRHRATGTIRLAESDTLLLPLVEAAGRMEIAGEADLTDYHSPLGEDPGDLESFGAALAGLLPAGTRFRFDSLPEEVAVPLAGGMRAGGVPVAPVGHAAAWVLPLPEDHRIHLDRLRGKDRHEIRRKIRRFEDARGGPRLAARNDPAALEAFFTMHRASGGEKGGFMTPEVERFFRDLAALDEAVVVLLSGDDGQPVAGAFGFEDEFCSYLYNSAFDPAVSELSPGVVLVDRLIAGAIDAGKQRFDFLKGDEAYKRRMGAEPRPLYVLEGTT